jgi:hypothetical protein
MSNETKEILLKTDELLKLEKYEKLRNSQAKANKKYYDNNKNKIIEYKKEKYEQLKIKPEFVETNKNRSKTYYEKNKDEIRRKNLERYHNKKNIVDLPTIES